MTRRETELLKIADDLREAIVHANYEHIVERKLLTCAMKQAIERLQEWKERNLK